MSHFTHAKLLLSFALLLTVSAIAQPKITSFSPSSAPAGAIVTITGSNFIDDPAYVNVYFGAVRAVVSNATYTQLKVVVPPGATYQPISVLVLTSGETAYSPRQFVPAFTNPFGSGISANFYKPVVNINNAGAVFQYSSAVRDLDGDGKPDLVIVNPVANTVSVLRNTAQFGVISTAAFAAQVDFPTGVEPRSVTVSDVDNDGKPDIIVVNRGSNTVSVLRNTGTSGSITTASFAAKVDFATGTNPEQVVANDLDGDGQTDLVVLERGSNSVSLLRNLSTRYFPSISFATRVSVEGIPAVPTRLAVGDLNGDGKPDLAVSAEVYSTIRLFRNNTTAGSLTSTSFSSEGALATGVGANFTLVSFYLEIADIDGDQKADIVGGCSAPNKLLLYRNTTSGTNTPFSFAGRAEPDVSSGLSALGIGDADGDGKPDLLIGNPGNSVSVLRNVSTSGSLTAASLASKVDFTTDFSPTSISLADIDGDGIPELVDVNQAQSVSLLQVSAPPSQTPVVSSFTPDKGPAGTTVTITGSNFNSTPSKNIVYFGAVKADVTGGSPTSLTVKAPAGATYQPLTVTDSATGLIGYASRPFNTLFTNPFGTGIAVNFYRQGVLFPIPTTIRSVVISDLDGDRKPDLITTNFSGSRTISVLRNKSATGIINTNSFESPVSFSSTQVSSSVGGPYEVATGDLDGDGKPEIVVSNYGAGTLEIFHNQSVPGVINSTSFAAPVILNLGANPPGSVTISDLDGDGKPELIAGAEGASRISIFVNATTRGNITAASFSNRINLATTSAPYYVAVRDLDQDGRPDIIAAVHGDNTRESGLITIFRNTAVPGILSVNSFAPRVEFTVGDYQYPFNVAVADFDGDGKQDIVYGTAFVLGILQNASTPGNITTATFSRVFTSGAGYSRSFVVDDLDGDGKPDIAGAGIFFFDTDFLVLRNVSGPGTLTSSSFTNTLPATGSFNNALAVGDLDGDGIPEVVAANSGTGVSVLKVNTPSALLPPTVGSFSPSSGPVGTAVTISGANFDTTAANNVVYFGAVKASVTAASATSLTVVVPPGATNQPVSVLNTTNNLTGYASKPFVTTFNNPLGPGIPDNFYRPKTDFATGTLPYAAALGDLNGDGKPDVVVANQNANTISVLRNISGPGGFLFAARTDLPVGADPRAVAVGDVTGDGRPDIVVISTAGSSIVSVLRNLSATPGGDISSSSFAPRVDFPVGATPSSLAIGDVNGDGKPDLIITSLVNGTVSVLRNTVQSGAIYPPSFAAPVSFAAGTYPRSVAVSDLDGDGRIDIAVVNERSNSVSVLRNTAAAGSIDASSFAPMSSFPTGSNPNYVTASDLDGDGKPDLVITNFGSNTVSVLRNTAMPGTLNTGSFAPKVDLATGSQPFSATTGDADGDGKLDIITVNAASNTVSVLRNLAAPGSIATSSFSSKVDFATGNYPVGIAMGDLDGDGIPELVPVNAGSNTVSVLAINIAQPPVITLFTPASGPAGATITITGANFNSTPASNLVYFGAVRADVTGGSSTSLTVKVPTGATYQPLTVLNSANGLIGYSSRSFITTFTNPFGSGIPANFYRPKVDFSTGASSFLYAVAFGDLDGDGKPDMVGVNRIAQTVSVLRNISGTGTITAASFAAPLVISTPNYPESVTLADIDGDGKLDIVAANPGSYNFSVLRNLASPGALTAASFAARVDISTGQYISSLAAGDLDQDGKTDIVVTNLYSGTVSVFRNTTTIGVVNASSFAAKADYPAGDGPRVVVIRDVNNDAKPELIVANEKSNNVSVLNNTTSAGFITSASFSTKIDYAAGSSPSGVAVGDLDEDGKPDIVVCNYGSNNVSVLRNTSGFGPLTAGSFAARVDFGTGIRPFFVALGDADGDSLVDLITANSGSDNVSVLRNAGSINTITGQSFAPRADFGTSGYPLWVALGDLDGDGTTELATANASNATISVLKVNTLPQTVARAASTGLQATAEATSTGTLQLYPNPTSGDFTLLLQGIKGAVAKAEVVDENGKVIERSVLNTGGKAARFTHRFSLRSQPAGVYYVKVTTIDGVQIVKVVVQR